MITFKWFYDIIITLDKMVKSLTTVVLLLQLLLQLSAFRTPDSNRYYLYSMNFGTINFRVKASTDVFFGLTTNDKYEAPRIVLIIAGWLNIQSGFFKNYNPNFQVTKMTPGYLSENEFRGFWVSWNNGHFEAGKEGSTEPFITHDEPEHMEIGYYGIGTGSGANGLWDIDGMEIGTSDLKSWRVIPYIPITYKVDLQVKTDGIATIALMGSNQGSHPIIEICLGHMSNSVSMIRYKEETVVRERTPDLLSDSAYQRFTIMWKGSYIEVQHNNKTLMKWANPNPFQITHIGINTNGGSGSWKSDTINLKSTKREIVTANMLRYKYFPFTADSLYFKVRAPNNAHIALTSVRGMSDPMYEVFIGWKSNTKSVIFKNTQKYVAVVDTPDILSADEHRGFWITWENGTLSVRKEGEYSSFLSYTAKHFWIGYYGICTGHGASGSWIIEDNIRIKESYEGEGEKSVAVVRRPKPEYRPPAETENFVA